MHTLDIDQLRTFLAVEATGSFTRAGEQVAKTQSAISVQIKKLEGQLGVRLFARGHGAVTITPEGRKLLPHARTIVDTSTEALAAFDPSALQGTVALGTADDYAERYLPAILAGFGESNPLVDVSVTCESTFALSRRIEAGELDVAIVTHTEATMPSELLRVEPLLWVTSDQHNTHEAEVLPLWLGSEHCCWRKQALEKLETTGRAHRLLYSSYSAMVISAGVAAGLAVSVLPESAVRPGMRVLGEHEGFPTLDPCEIGIVRSATRTNPVIDALVEHIRHCLEVIGPRRMTDGLKEVSMDRLMSIARAPRAAGSASARAN